MLAQASQAVWVHFTFQRFWTLFQSWPIFKPFWDIWGTKTGNCALTDNCFFLPYLLMSTVEATRSTIYTKRSSNMTTHEMLLLCSSLKGVGTCIPLCLVLGFGTFVAFGKFGYPSPTAWSMPQHAAARYSTVGTWVQVHFSKKHFWPPSGPLPDLAHFPAFLELSGCQNGPPRAKMGSKRAKTTLSIPSGLTTTFEKVFVDQLLTLR